MKLKVLNGKENKEIAVPKEFEVNASPASVTQVLTALLANARRSTAQVKTRGDVSGGGRKPWRQKGTGRARVGSNRSPLWIGGGVVFGPTSKRNYKQKIDRKLNQKVILSLLNEKIKNNKLVLVTEKKFASHKTNDLIKYLSKLPIEENSTILMVWDEDAKLYLSARNLPYLKLVSSNNFNALDVANYDYILADQDLFKKVMLRFGNK